MSEYTEHLAAGVIDSARTLAELRSKDSTGGAPEVRAGRARARKIEAGIISAANTIERRAREAARARND